VKAACSSGATSRPEREL